MSDEAKRKREIREYYRLEKIVICLIASSLKDPLEENVNERLNSIEELNGPFDKNIHLEHFTNIEKINNYFINYFEFPYRHWELSFTQYRLMKRKYPHLIEHLDYIPPWTLLYTADSDDDYKKYMFKSCVNAIPLYLMGDYYD